MEKRGGKMLTAYWRTLFIYLVLIVVIRLMGKRQIGQMEPSEFVVTMFVANLASILVEDVELPMYRGVIPIATVLALEVVLAGLSILLLFGCNATAKGLWKLCRLTLRGTKACFIRKKGE